MWEIFVPVWIYFIVGFVAGVLLTWLFWVRPVQKRADAAARAAARRTPTSTQTQSKAVDAPERDRQDTQAREKHSGAGLAAGAVGGAAAAGGAAALAGRDDHDERGDHDDRADRDDRADERTGDDGNGRDAVLAPRPVAGRSAQPPAPERDPAPAYDYTPSLRPAQSDEDPNEQTAVFDFGDPNELTQTRHFEEDDDPEPWQPTVMVDPDDRLSDQLPKRTQAQPARPQPSGEHVDMFDASSHSGGASPAVPVEVWPVEEPEDAQPSAAESGAVSGTAAAEDIGLGSRWSDTQDTDHGEYFSFLDERAAKQHTQSAAQDDDYDDGAPQPGEPRQLSREELTRGLGDANGWGSEAFSLQQKSTESAEPEALPRRVPGAGAAGAAAAGPLGQAKRPSAGGSLFEPAAAGGAPDAAASQNSAEAPSASVPMGPFGPGSALPRPDGSAPSTEFTVKARTSSMVFHTDDSPFFDRLLPQVWFRTADDAAGAGFTSWERPQDSWHA